MILEEKFCFECEELDVYLEMILQELTRAEELHPKWPKDIIHAVAIVNEESGEVTKAAWDFIYKNGPLYEVQVELIQTAAMCIRMLLHMEKYYEARKTSSK